MKDSVILITGSSHANGMGGATAKLATERGAKVILHGREDSQELQDLARSLNAEYIVCDVANKQAVEQAVSGVLSKTKRVDALINCAGTVVPVPFLEAEDENWLHQFQVNVLGIVHFVQAVIPHMQKVSKGRIVNVSSIRGHASMASGRGMGYSVSKAGINNLTSSLAKEYAPHIAVNAVSPGFVQTGLSKTWNDTVRQQLKTALVGRVGQPEEIAEVLLFLASDKASFVTGQTWIVDGGYEIAGK